jgi:hypothetical protein
MDETIFRANLEVISDYLHGQRGFTATADPAYGTLFQCEIVPCCIPLPVLVWLNPHSQGVFVRIIFPPIGKLADEQIAKLNRINYNLPSGVFVADQESGEVRFKSTLFIGNTPLSAGLLEELLRSSVDMVRSEHGAVVQIVTGRAHGH